MGFLKNLFNMNHTSNNTIRCNKWCNSTGTQAFLCEKCGYGEKADLCSICRKETGAIQFRAQLCNDHGYGTMSQECCRCGRGCSSSAKIVAHLCAECGNGQREDYCCKMIEPKHSRA